MTEAAAPKNVLKSHTLAFNQHLLKIQFYFFLSFFFSPSSFSPESLYFGGRSQGKLRCFLAAKVTKDRTVFFAFLFCLALKKKQTHIIFKAENAQTQPFWILA